MTNLGHTTLLVSVVVGSGSCRPPPPGTSRASGSRPSRPSRARTLTSKLTTNDVTVMKAALKKKNSFS